MTICVLPPMPSGRALVSLVSRLDLGLLARYDRMEQVARWRDRLHSGDGRLGALWLLVGSTGGAERPTIDRRAVPVLSGNDWARIPDSWLKNTHRAAASKGPTP